MNKYRVPTFLGYIKKRKQEKEIKEIIIIRRENICEVMAIHQKKSHEALFGIRLSEIEYMLNPNMYAFEELVIHNNLTKLNHHKCGIDSCRRELEELKETRKQFKSEYYADI